MTNHNFRCNALQYLRLVNLTMLIWLEMSNGTEREGKKKRGKLCSSVLFHQNNAPAHTSSQAPSASVFARPWPQWLLFLSKTERIHKRMEISWQWGCCPHCKWLAGRKDQEFFYNGIRALEQHWAKRISIGWDYVERWQNNKYIFCCCVKLWTFVCPT